MIPSGQHGLLVGGACGVFSILDQVRKSGNMSLMQHNCCSMTDHFLTNLFYHREKSQWKGR